MKKRPQRRYVKTRAAARIWGSSAAALSFRRRNEMAHRIAVASSNGRFIDTHFGHAERFDVYELDGEGSSFVETRDARSACLGRGHDESAFEGTLALLSDCEAIFVSVIGYGAAAYLNGKGMRVFESPYFAIPDVLDKVRTEGLLEPGDRSQRTT
jgi:predicted Fe-Mo cluster-binding NifX family protein